jgi:membrane fusion protein (multidrug efflux system)
MFVRAVVSEGINEAAILVPQQSVSQDTKGNPVVLVVDAQGKVEQRAWFWIGPWVTNGSLFPA